MAKKLGEMEASVLIMADTHVLHTQLGNPIAFKSLLMAGLIEGKGTLTQKGLVVQKQLLEREALLIKGLPFSEHKPNAKAAYRDNVWYRVRVGDQDITACNFMLFAGKPRAGMEVQKAPIGGFNGSIRKLYVNTSKECTMEVIPSLFRIPFIGGPKLIDFEDFVSGKKVVTIQAMFFDFVANDHRKNLRFNAKNSENPVVVWGKSTTNEDRVVAVIAPFVEV